MDQESIEQIKLLGRAVDKAKRAAARNSGHESLARDADMSSSLQDFSENDIIGYPGCQVNQADDTRHDP